ncbi:hypothetical protein JHK85_054139 [Glycine max]|nr:hypothetical protein JHK85_054139 [Glycine max]
MAMLNNSDTTTPPQIIQIPPQAPQQRLPFTVPIKAQVSSFPNTTTVAGQTARRVFKILFYLHLFLVAALVTLLTIYGLVSDSHTHHFHPKKWYPQLLASAACAGIVGFTWQWITARHSTRVVRLVFWLSPLLICAMGIMFVCIGTAVSLAVGVIALNPGANPLFNSHWNPLLLFSGGWNWRGRAIENRTKLAAFFIFLILLSLGWTMQFLKNAMYVTISRVKYMNFAGGVDMDTRVAFCDTIKHLTGSVSMGSILVPVIVLFRGFARTTSLVGGDTDEFMFSCASTDTWEMFIRVGLEQLIDLDLTGAFCFLSGVGTGAICSLVSGIWSIVMHKSYATEVSIYAFLIGYFICRLAIAWVQACVSAYYVAYAENPQSTQFDSTIPVRLEQLNRSQALQIFRGLCNLQLKDQSCTWCRKPTAADPACTNKDTQHHTVR